MGRTMGNVPSAPEFPRIKALSSVKWEIPSNPVKENRPAVTYDKTQFNGTHSVFRLTGNARTADYPVQIRATDDKGRAAEFALEVLPAIAVPILTLQSAADYNSNSDCTLNGADGREISYKLIDRKGNNFPQDQAKLFRVYEELSNCKANEGSCDHNVPGETAMTPDAGSYTTFTDNYKMRTMGFSGETITNQRFIAKGNGLHCDLEIKTLHNQWFRLLVVDKYYDNPSRYCYLVNGCEAPSLGVCTRPPNAACPADRLTNCVLGK